MSLQDDARWGADQLDKDIVTSTTVGNAIALLKSCADELDRLTAENERGNEAIILLSQIELCLKNGMTPAQILLGNTPIRCALTDFAANKPSGAINPLEGVSQDALDGGWTAKGLIAHAKRVEDELAAVTADGDAMRRDAERYRWLRDKSPEHQEYPISATSQTGDGIKVTHTFAGDPRSLPTVTLFGEIMDKAIDAAKGGTTNVD